MRQDVLDTAITLRRSLARLSRRSRMESRETGLSTTKHSILGQLYRDGPKSPKDIALAEGVQPQSITRSLEGLEEAGLVLRTQDKLDRRQFHLEITAKGRELVVRDAHNRSLWLASAMESNLTGLEMNLLRISIQLLDKIADAAAADQSDETGRKV